jgi:XFP N-terminal domain
MTLDQEAMMATVLSEKERALIDAYWRAANYLSVGQIYLYDNPLLQQSLTKEHIKPRLLGHWGTTPGLNFIYVHLNRVIKKHDLDMIYITGPGHGGPGLVANAYLEGTYSEVYPNISPDEEGMKRLFTQFSFPGGIPSHVAPETPGRGVSTAVQQNSTANLKPEQRSVDIQAADFILRPRPFRRRRRYCNNAKHPNQEKSATKDRLPTHSATIPTPPCASMPPDDHWLIWSVAGGASRERARPWVAP